MSFYAKFRELCEKKGVTQTTAALAVGLSRSAPTKWALHDANPTLYTLERLAEYFGVSVGVLTDTEQDDSDLNGFPEIRMIARAGKKMTPEARQNLLKYARFMFPEAFEDQGK
jgi:transcriptional regulator with XRE-family HTH domain